RPARLLDRFARGLVPQEDHRDARAVLGERQQDTCAVARLAVGGGRAAVADVVQTLEQRIDDLARGAAGRVGNEADPAGVTFQGWAERRPHKGAPRVEWMGSASG